MADTDERLIEKYYQFSTDRYCAIFIDPDPGTVRHFREWLSETSRFRPEGLCQDFMLGPEDREEWHQKMLAEYHRQQGGVSSLNQPQ